MEYTQNLLGDSSINNAKVVKCVHERIGNDTCVYCNMTGMRAMLDDTTYTDIDAAVADWLQYGGLLRLYTDYSKEIDLGTAASPLAINLNGHKFNQGMSMELSGVQLTITDTAEQAGVFGRLNVGFGALTLESGVLEEGYYLRKDDKPVEPLEKLVSDDTYQVGKTDISVGGDGSNLGGSIAVGKYRVPVAAIMEIGDDSVDLGSYYDEAKGEAAVENGRLILPIQAVDTDAEGDIGTVTVKAHSTNVFDITLTINVSATNKKIPQLDGALTLSPAGITYGDMLGTDTRIDRAAQSGAVSMEGYTYNEAPGTPALTDRTGDSSATVNIAITEVGALPTPTPAVPTSTPAGPTPTPGVPTSTPEPEYRIIDGADSTWTQDTDGSLVIRGNGEFSKFQTVKVDGIVVDPKNYIVTEGSTIITLKAEFLDTLSEGSHTFEIVWTDGSAQTGFVVTLDDSEEDDDTPAQTPGGGKDTPGTTVPPTGDNSNPALWITLLLAALAGLAVIIVKTRKNENR